MRSIDYAVERSSINTDRVSLSPFSLSVPASPTLTSFHTKHDWYLGELVTSRRVFLDLINGDSFHANFLDLRMTFICCRRVVRKSAAQISTLGKTSVSNALAESTPPRRHQGSFLARRPFYVNYIRDQTLITAENLWSLMVPKDLPRWF